MFFMCQGCFGFIVVCLYLCDCSEYERLQVDRWADVVSFYSGQTKLLDELLTGLTATDTEVAFGGAFVLLIAAGMLIKNFFWNASHILALHVPTNTSAVWTSWLVCVQISSQGQPPDLFISYAAGRRIKLVVLEFMKSEDEAVNSAGAVTLTRIWMISSPDLTDSSQKSFSSLFFYPACVETRTIWTEPSVSVRSPHRDRWNRWNSAHPLCCNIF